MLLEYAIGVVRSIVDQANEQYRSYSETASLSGSEPIPESFLTGWADYEAGRVVDMARVLENEPPPA
jgi:hypothetical protein